MNPLRCALIGDAESPHLLKWARALAARPDIALWAASSRGFAPGFEDLLPVSRQLALHTSPDVAGGNGALMRHLPRLAAWLRPIGADWLNPHYLTSHGTLAWLARRMGVPGRIVGSAWGSDVLVTPTVSAPMKWLTQRVLRACDLTTSDSQYMAGRMRDLGAREVMVFPFGLEAMPLASVTKDNALFFANRGLEPIYAPEQVLEAFAAVATSWPAARLVVANDGSLSNKLKTMVESLGLAQRVSFVGRLDTATQAAWYARARWYLSLPRSDSVSVSVLEAMAHGCVPILSDIPANHELVEAGRNGLVLSSGAPLDAADLRRMLPRADLVAANNRKWVESNAMFPVSVDQFVARLHEISAAR